MKILQSIWSLASENGGPTRSTIGLSKALARAGAEVMLVSHVPGKVPLMEQDDLRECGVQFREGRGNGVFTAYRDSCLMMDEFRPDIVHLQGLWKMSTHAMNAVASKQGVPIVISPRGMLDPWALSVKKWKKKLGMFLYQHDDLKKARAFHAASGAEAEHIRDFGLDQPIITAPNGVNLPDVLPLRTTGDSKRERTALFLSRLHPGKGLMLLAEAWAEINPKGWRMLVVGPDGHGHGEDVKRRLRELGMTDHWTFRGEVGDVEKWRIYRSADLFIHPSASENFGLSIAEALAAGVPVITTKGCPWSEIQGSCGWWIDRNRDALASAMREAIALTDDQRYSMGAKGHRLIQQKYTWPAIANQMVKGYESLFNMV